MARRPRQQRQQRRPRRPMSMSGMGFELAAAVTGFTFLGIWIDRRYDSEPWGLLICAAIGVTGGLYNFVRAARIAAAKAAAPSEGTQSPEEGS